MANILLQIFLILCLIGIIIILFFDKGDYLTYTVIILILAILICSLILPEARSVNTYILAIRWEIILFLVCMVVSVEILEPFFEELARRILKKNIMNQRIFFYTLCLFSMFLASVIEDLSVSIIILPFVIKLCRKSEISPLPYLFGVTICLNLAAAISPFASAENVLIANDFELNFVWFFQNMGLYFIITTVLTLFFLDVFILRKNIKTHYTQRLTDEEEHSDFHFASLSLIKDIKEHSTESPIISSNLFLANSFVLILYFVGLVLIENFVLVGIIILLILTILNPVGEGTSKKHPDLIFHAKNADFKLIYFFICFFILETLMELNGIIDMIAEILLNQQNQSIIVLCIILMVIVSVLSGLIDDAPVTIIFHPVIVDLLSTYPEYEIPILFAFIIGINIGSNILPQGAASDLMALEIAQKERVVGFSYLKLVKVGGLFAIFHVLIAGIFLFFMV